MPTNDYRQYVTVLQPERFDLDFASFYAGAARETASTRESVRHVLDLPYGDDAKQRLDIYLPDQPVANAPVLVHMHGGGFVEGDRLDYGFLARHITALGALLVLPSYRLCSDGFAMLDAVADTKLAIEWVHGNIAQHGGRGSSIVLSGHSAGAIMSGNVIADLAWMEEAGIPTSFIAAAVLISGVYNFPLDFNARNDILTNAEVKVAMSAMQHIGRPPRRVYLAVGSIETGPKDDYVASAKAFCAALLRNTDAEVDLVVLPGLNHIETSQVLGEPGSAVFDIVQSELTQLA